MDHRLRGKVVITGGERGAVTSVSVEGKRLGLGRGMSLKEIKIRRPEAIVVPSDYRSYSIYAQRMYSIVRTYTPSVEEYSIDECFADITTLDQRLGTSYEDLSRKIKEDLETSLGITFGVGLAPTKTLAKIASKANKPAGFTSISNSEQLQYFLQKTPIHFVWGLGGVSGVKLMKLGVDNAWLFTQKDETWLSMHRLGKAYRDIWLELRGESIKFLENKTFDDVGSLMRTRTFTPPSKNREFIFSELSKNVEEVCENARRHEVKARAISFYLKTQEFTYHSVSLKLTIPVASPTEILKHVQEHFDEVFAQGILYRASGITLHALIADQARTPDLFGQIEALEKRARFIKVFDAINHKYGRHTLALASSLHALKYRETKSRGRKPDGLSPRSCLALSIDQKHRALQIPYLGIAK